MPNSKLSAVRMDLANVLYISYLVPSARIGSLVPRILPLATNENDQVYISFVAMKCFHVRLSILPWPRFNYDQLNLRTYVTDPKTGNPAVYFFQSGVSLRIVPILTRIMGIPWEKVSFNLDSTSQPRYRASGYWLGNLSFEIDSAADEIVPESVVHHITGSMMGFMGSEGKMRSIRINHRALEVKSAVLRNIRFPLPVEKGLVTDDELQKPDSVLLVPNAEFTVYFPPRSVSKRG